MNTSTILKNAKDLTREPPRSPRVRLAGYVIMARMIDKGRATINGTAGDYHFNCSLDNMLFNFKGLNGEEVRQVLASGASEEEIVAWINSHGKLRTPQQIKEWSDATEKISLAQDPDKGEWFTSECSRLRLDPAKATLFDLLEADDRSSVFGSKG